MSYNGIGLPTPRGTGTSGYVQKNTSSLNSTAWSRKGVYAKRQELQKLNESRQSKFLKRNIATREVDQGIIDHEKKRKIEIECVKLRSQLEDDREERIENGEDENNLLTDEQIEQQVAQLRERLKKEENQKSDRYRGYSNDKYDQLSFRFKHSDSKKDRRNNHEDYSDGKSAHTMALEKSKDNEKFKKALEWSEESKRQSKPYRRRERSLSPVRSDEERDRNSNNEERKHSSTRTRRNRTRSEREIEGDYYYRRKDRDDRGRYYTSGIGHAIDYDGYNKTSKEHSLDYDSCEPTTQKKRENDNKQPLSKPLAPYRETKSTVPEKPIEAETLKSSNSTDANLPEKPGSNHQSDSDSNNSQESTKIKEEPKE